MRGSKNTTGNEGQVATMMEHEKYWFRTPDDFVWHVFRNGISLCKKKLYAGTGGRLAMPEGGTKCVPCVDAFLQEGADARRLKEEEKKADEVREDRERGGKAAG